MLNVLLIQRLKRNWAKRCARDREKQRNKKKGKQTEKHRQSLKLNEFTSASLSSTPKENISRGRIEEMFAQKYLWKMSRYSSVEGGNKFQFFSLTFCSQISFMFFFFCCIIETINVIKHTKDINSWHQNKAASGGETIASRDFDAGKREKPVKQKIIRRRAENDDLQ